MRFEMPFAVSAPLECGFMGGFMSGLRFQTKILLLACDLFTWVAESAPCTTVKRLQWSKRTQSALVHPSPFAAYGLFQVR